MPKICVFELCELCCSIIVAVDLYDKTMASKGGIRAMSANFLPPPSILLPYFTISISISIFFLLNCTRLLRVWSNIWLVFLPVVVVFVVMLTQCILNEQVNIRWTLVVRLSNRNYYFLFTHLKPLVLNKVFFSIHLSPSLQHQQQDHIIPFPSISLNFSLSFLYLQFSLLQSLQFASWSVNQKWSWIIIVIVIVVISLKMVE